MSITIDIRAGLEKQTKVVHTFKLCLEVGATLANQDDYFNMGVVAETWEITQQDTCAVLNLWTDAGTRNKHTCSPPGHRLAVKNGRGWLGARCWMII